jgi:surface polysaccharide O-acyltransferase-like enzyme
MAYGSFNQAYFMGLLFLIGGYFVPPSYDRRGPRNFVIERLIRLGGPTLLYMLVLHPLVEIVKMKFDHSSQDIGSAYLHYLADFSFLRASGPLWFAEVLLILSLFYAFGRMAGVFLPPKQLHMRAVGHGGIFAIALLICSGSFAVRLVQPMGVAISNFQFGFFTQYVVLFAIGIYLGRRNGLMTIPRRLAMRWWGGALSLGILFWGVIVVFGGAWNGDTAPYAGGWRWQAAAYAIWESFFCVGICLGLLVIFRERCNRRGPLGRFLSANAFGVYVFHPPILVTVSLILRPVTLAPLPKAILVAAITLPLCFLVSVLAGRAPGLRRIIR